MKISFTTILLLLGYSVDCVHSFSNANIHRPCSSFAGMGMISSSVATNDPAAPSTAERVDDDDTLTTGLANLVQDFEGHNKELLIKMEKMLRKAQISITKAIQDIDGGATFKEDAWVRDTGGGGYSRVLQNGNVWEKAGVNLAVVYGDMPQEALRAASTTAAAASSASSSSKSNNKNGRIPFSACGLSCVMHPKNPHCPTMHFNYRLFQTQGGHWWFGGGTDITPCFINEDDMRHFHGTYKNVCDEHDMEFYPKFKQWADNYFVITHRGETRGLGGIFFDDLNDRSADAIFDFCKDAVNHVVAAYGPIIEKHKNDAFTEDDKRWQLLRRGRYVEFNLVYDRGTIFGLKTGGRIESILMSLPETARWEYDHHPEPGTPQADFLDACRNPREWV
jgi:coproporphyrinogen III oxidase